MCSRCTISGTSQNRRLLKPNANKPKSQSRLGVVGSEELAWGCAGVCLAIGGFFFS